MSEVRKVKVDIKDIESVKEACDELGIEMNTFREGSYVLTNHGVKTYGNTPIYLDREGDVFSIRGDDLGRGLDDLTKKIKSAYNMKLIKKQAKNLGYSVVEEKNRNGKKVLKLRTYR